MRDALRLVTLMLALWIAGDLMTPAIPGAFSLERAQLFVEMTRTRDAADAVSVEVTREPYPAPTVSLLMTTRDVPGLARALPPGRAPRQRGWTLRKTPARMQRPLVPDAH